MIINEINNKPMQKSNEDFEDSGLKLIQKPTFYIPYYVSNLMRTINEEKEVDDKDEFSIYLPATTKGFIVSIKEEYFIPLQAVHGAETDNAENRPDKRFNTAIHRHPDNLNSFSGGDNTYINRNFEFSLLWTEKDGFVKAQWNMFKNGQRLVLDCDFYIIRPHIEIVGIKKIKKYVEKPEKVDYVVEDDTETSSTYTYNNGTWESPNLNFTLHSWKEWEGLGWTYNYTIKLWQRKEWVSRNAPSNGLSLFEGKQQDKVYSVDEKDREWLKPASAYCIDNTTGAEETDAQHRASFYCQYLDTAEKNYTANYEPLTNEFYDLMYVFICSANYLKWQDNSMDNFAESMAKQWVNENYADTFRRVKNIYQLMVSQKIKDQLNKITV